MFTREQFINILRSGINSMWDLNPWNRTLATVGGDRSSVHIKLAQGSPESDPQALGETTLGAVGL